jgi:TetR/AcrR family transcriptional repressor of nem operon
MRYAEDHKAQTHQRILQEASARFRRDGIGATGLQPLMKALGLTHGGFYAHFKSKDELVEKALRAAVDQSKERTAKTFDQEGSVSAFLDMYLSPAHRDSPEKGCPLPTMCAELGQRGEPSAITDEMLKVRIEALEKAMADKPDADARSLVMMSTVIGALTMARSVQDKAFSEQILQTTREWLKQNLNKA